MKESTNRLRVLRAEKRLSQMDTAEAAGISFNRYWRIEAGYAEPTEQERQHIARVLHVHIDQAFPAQRCA
jgi:transcriptional regulator with XRE-family HTH domain